MELMNHQRQLADHGQGLAVGLPLEGLAASGMRLGVGWEPGLGKTIGLLATIAAVKAGGFAGRVVVVAPKSILWSAWARDAEQFTELKVVVCWAGSAAKRRKLIEQDADIYVLNYEAFKVHHLELLGRGVDWLVCDESSKAKDPNTQISKILFWFSQRVSRVHMLSGTPAPNSPHEYFAQVRCIDPSIFGTSYYRFLSTYFVPEKRFIEGKERIIGWRMPWQAEAGFRAKLAKCWWTLRASDCLDLPAETDVIRDVTLGPAEAECYVNLLQEMKHQWEDGQVTHVEANTRSMKLRQITGGHLYEKEGIVRTVGDSKLSILMELLEELGKAQVVIWAEFRAEINRIVCELGVKGKGVGKIDGSVHAADRAARIAEFQAGKLQYLACHPAAGAHGITLTAARYDVFYSLSFSLEQHQQARKRIHRVGQHWPVTHHYLLCPGTVDGRVLKVLRGKGSAAEEMKEMLVGEQSLAAAAAEVPW
jgi:SNF2 family DNA or RNA helicase